jgi:hypothetical protein
MGNVVYKVCMRTRRSFKNKQVKGAVGCCKENYALRRLRPLLMVFHKPVWDKRES